MKLVCRLCACCALVLSPPAALSQAHREFDRVTRVVDGDRYAGTWQSGRFGGLMYGRIEKRNTDQQK